jgi:hypothetical protein
LKTGRICAIALIALSALLMAGSNWAQTPGRAGKGPVHPPQGVDPDAAKSSAPDNLADQARLQLEELQDDLRLASTQRAVWSAYADKVSKLADDVTRNRNAVRFPKGSAPEQLELLAETLRNRLTAVEDIVDAGKALYATLTPTQRTLADGRLARVSIPLLVPTLSIAEGAARGTRDGGTGAPRSP